MRNRYEKLMVDLVGVVAVAALCDISDCPCAGDQTISFTGMQNTRNGP